MAEGIVLCFHTPTNTGYAIGPQEALFFRAATEVVGAEERVHLWYKSIDGAPDSVPASSNKVCAFDLLDKSRDNQKRLYSYVKENNLKIFLGYDAPVKSPLYRAMRAGGMRTVVSHQGAPLSSLQRGVKLFAKRCEMAMNRSGPDLFILQSIGMQDTAVYGRGIPLNKTCVIHTGVDICKNSVEFDPDYSPYELFSIPRDRKIVFYSGHFEERKGVQVIVRAAIELIDGRGESGWHFLLFGNQPGEDKRIQDILVGTKAADHVTLGGYRRDLHKIRPHCYLGTVATTGWDSFPRSTIEMQASGLPTMVSNLPGVNETIIDGHTGFLFEPNNHKRLADLYSKVGGDPVLRETLSSNARDRIVREFTVEIQQQTIVAALMAIDAKRCMRA
jgi:glycosyltransferase involved in cell wall biosynthesis